MKFQEFRTDMYDPHLKKACWLTREQRYELEEGALRAREHKKASTDLCESLISELSYIENRIEALKPIVQSVVSGLKLPSDALPVYISFAESQQVCRYGKISQELQAIIHPPLRRGKIR